MKLTKKEKEKILLILTREDVKKSVIIATKNGYKVVENIKDVGDPGELPSEYVKVLFNDGTHPFYIHKNNLKL